MIDCRETVDDVYRRAVDGRVDEEMLLIREGRTQMHRCI